MRALSLQKTITEKLIVNDMSAIKLDNKAFREKVYDYEKNQNEWKFEGGKPAIVDFFATWCGPCNAMAPVLEELSDEYAGKLDIYKVDVDNEPELSALFRIRSIPTLLFIPADGTPSINVGALPKAQLKRIIEEKLL